MVCTRNLVILGAVMAASQTSALTLRGRNLQAAADASASAQAVAQAVSDVPQGGWVPGQNCIAASGDAHASASAKGELSLRFTTYILHPFSNLFPLNIARSGRHGQR